MGALIGVLLALAGVVVVIVLVGITGKARLEKNQGAWRTVAGDLGLIWRETPDDPGVGRVDGEMDGFKVSIYRERLQDIHRPSRRWPVTRVRTELGLDLGAGMAVASKKVGGGWAMKAAMQPPVRLGDPAFELRVLAHAAQPQAAAPLLGERARAALLAGDEAIPGFYLDDSGILTEFQGIERDRAKLVATARGQVALAKALRSAWGK